MTLLAPKWPDADRGLQQSYSEWVRGITSRQAASKGRLTSLFASSIPEPRDLLAELVSSGFAQPIDQRYTSAFAQGNPFVVEYLARRYAVSPQQVLCTTGATGALRMLYRALAAPGDHVLVETPGFDLFYRSARDAGLDVGFFNRSGVDFAIDVDEVMAQVRPATRMIVLSNLHNPSGHVVPHATLVALADAARKRGVLVIADEVYGDYADQTARPRPAAAIAENMVSVSSLTKIYGLHAVRCGWVIAAEDIVDKIRAYSDQFEFGVSNLGHAAAALVLRDTARFDAFTAGFLDDARPAMAERLDHWKKEGWVEVEMPAFGCITFPRLIGMADTEAFCERLWEQTGVLVAPGKYFGAPDHIRIGFGTEIAQLKTGLDALEAALRAHASDAAAPMLTKSR